MPSLMLLLQILNVLFTFVIFLEKLSIPTGFGIKRGMNNNTK